MKSKSPSSLMEPPECFDDEEEQQQQQAHYVSGSASKLQPRAVVSRASWNDEMAMAKVVLHKGTFSKSTGIVRSGKLYYSIPEVLFLVEIGALVVSDETDTDLSLEDLYVKMSSGKCGCCWEEFRAYRQLKSLGYIAGRHGIPWSVKKAKSKCDSIFPKVVLKVIRWNQKRSGPSLACLRRCRLMMLGRFLMCISRTANSGSLVPVIQALCSVFLVVHKMYCLLKI